jgi:carboxyl-terminal processing protease
MAIDGMLRALDPHSHFYGEAEWKNLLDEQRSEYAGIGVTIANFEKDGAADTFVLSTFPGSPAAKAGLAFGDRIVAVDGESTTNSSPDLVRDKIRGPVGSSFRLSIERAASVRIETIEIHRGRVPQPSIPDAYMLRPGIGYIDLSEGFNYTTSDEFDAALRELKRAGMRSLILDLRGNGGGIVEQAVKVAEKFLPLGTKILTQRGRTRLDNREWTSKNVSHEKMPLVVVVDRYTASASEIVAGAFQDNDRAIIVGEKTFGKGLVQSVIRLPGGTGVTLTTGRYMTPSGRSIQRDYSSGDIYDYFSHRVPAAAIDQPFFEARTASNRKVYGGDGIQPDEEIRPDTLTGSRAGFLDPIFFFTREAVYGRVKGQEKLLLSHGRRIASTDLAVSDSLFSAFQSFLIRNYYTIPKGQLARETTFVRTRLRYYMAIAAFGGIPANQVLAADDPQISRAIASLARAADLSNFAHRSTNRAK